MGLDISIIRTGRNIDLGQLYAIQSAVANDMDWYLGDDKSQRCDKYVRLKEKALLLSREKVIKDAQVSEQTRSYLRDMDKDQFAIYLSWVLGTIVDFTSSENTHLSFDWDLLPGINVLDSCSWNLKDIFNRCAKEDGTSYPDGDFIVELDLRKIAEENARWKKNGWKMKLAKVVEWFFPTAGGRIATDCAKDLGINDYFIEPRDLLYYKGEIEKVAKFMNESNDRLWLVSSY
jgi:hypothetical protein